MGLPQWQYPNAAELKEMKMLKKQGQPLKWQTYCMGYREPDFIKRFYTYLFNISWENNEKINNEQNEI